MQFIKACIAKSLLTPFHVLMVDPRLPNIFFGCPNHHLTQVRILSDILHLPLNTYLFGNSNLSREENEMMFDVVHKYIIQTQTFDVN